MGHRQVVMVPVDGSDQSHSWETHKPQAIELMTRVARQYSDTVTQVPLFQLVFAITTIASENVRPVSPSRNGFYGFTMTLTMVCLLEFPLYRRLYCS